MSNEPVEVQASDSAGVTVVPEPMIGWRRDTDYRQVGGVRDALHVLNLLRYKIVSLSLPISRINTKCLYIWINLQFVSYSPELPKFLLNFFKLTSNSNVEKGSRSANSVTSAMSHTAMPPSRRSEKDPKPTASLSLEKRAHTTLVS